MRIVRHLFTQARGTLGVAALANAANGAASAGLMAWIHTLVSPERAELTPLFATTSFLALLVLIFASGLIGQISLVRMAARSAFDIRLWLVRRVLALPLRRLEQIGGDRVYACLTQDVATVSNAWIALPIIGFNAAVVLGGVGYLIWLSWKLSLVVLAALGLGLLAYQRLAARGRARMAQFREQQDTLYAHFEALVRGAKELRSSARRAEQLLHADLEPDTRALRQLQTQAFSTWALGTNWGNVLTLAGVGVVLMASAALGRNLATEALGFVLALLFLRAHLAGVLNALPALAQGEVALRKIEALGLAGEDEPARAFRSVEAASQRPWKRLTLAGVEYGYGDSGAFHLGPLDVELRRGEIVFVTGGNGSGKSTFVKLLVGLYRPDAGLILLDGERVDPESESYRARFGALFSDYHLFSRLTTRADADALPQAEKLLEQLGLASKVDASAERVLPGGLSAGERRRLAFVSAHLEQAEIYVLDEWAADQDPHYRAAFYHEYLPALRERGATVVVITHDDRYFHCGDRLIHFEEGQATWQPREPARRLAVEPA